MVSIVDDLRKLGAKLETNCTCREFDIQTVRQAANLLEALLPPTEYVLIPKGEIHFSFVYNIVRYIEKIKGTWSQEQEEQFFTAECTQASPTSITKACEDLMKDVSQFIGTTNELSRLREQYTPKP